MNITPALLFGALSVFGLQDSLDEVRERFLKADRDFSKLSEAKGPAEAFATFLTDDAYLLHGGSHPVTGKDSIRGQYANFPKDASLTWKPTVADCSTSGELGYTMGTYTSRGKNPDGTPRVREGTYLTVWKQQEDGSLKAIADMGPPKPTPTDSVGRTTVRKPIRVETSSTGDFGLSFGRLEITVKGMDGPAHVEHAKYILAWRKYADGSKKVLIDMSSPSPSR